MKPLSDSELASVMKRVCKEEGLGISKDVAQRIIKCSGGSAREALVYLEGVSKIDTDKERLAWVESSDPQRQAIELCRALCNSRTSWKEITDIIGKISDEPEGLRHMVLGYAGKVLQSTDLRKAGRAFIVANEFKDPFYNRGKTDLLRACFSALHADIGE